MKRILTSVLLVLTASAVIAAPQTSFTTTSKPKKPTKSTVTKKKPAAPLQKEETRGVLSRAFAPGNNPLQMLNPTAPPEKYGTSQQHVAYDPYTGKPMGIKLFEIVF